MGDQGNNLGMTKPVHGSIVGLHVGSRVFYCNRATLSSKVKSSYFNSRFSTWKNLEDDEMSYVDPNGVQVFFIERDGDLFEHILKFMTRNSLNLPSFQDNQTLWRDLREEAKFYALDSLFNLLQVTQSVRINSSVKGIFHWLGNRRQEPCSTCMDSGEIEVGRFDDKDGHFIPSSLSKSVLLQHHQKPVLETPPLDSLLNLDNDELRKLVTPDHITCTLWNDAVISLDSVSIRPSHVTMRIHYDDLERAQENSFNLEASKDGVYWDLLHLTSCHQSPHAGQEKANFMVDLAVFVQPDGIPPAVRSEHFIKAVDRLLRRTWEVEKTKEFYKFFRFVGARAGQYPDRRGGSLEMFGDVHEE
ncbi:expressed unknown protein [Seminavis robusta]|uniref:BTB domain-containing protein n=1 Tax=Seminavis robusta TaxID=568900 RepID=A0A9N8DTA3_9STRA|nr:expressed unknown protein [Seminavis robusta]|eukprot:Sro326_g118090.1 n/a (359) ;mRNA; r:32032-33108